MQMRPEQAPTRVERGGLVRDPGVTNAHDERDHRPDPPPRPPEPQHDEYGEKRPRDAPLPRPEQRIADVPAVELAERQEVEGGHEQAEPRREPERMEEQVTAGRNVRVHEPGDGLERERFAEDHHPALGELGDGPREPDPGKEHRERHDEAGKRPRRPDVEQLALVHERGADADEGTRSCRYRRGPAGRTGSVASSR